MMIAVLKELFLNACRERREHSAVLSGNILGSETKRPTRHPCHLHGNSLTLMILICQVSTARGHSLML